MAGHQLVISLGGGLAYPPHRPLPGTGATRRDVATLRSDVVPNPLGGGTRSSLRSPSGQVGKASLPTYLVWDAVDLAHGRLLGHAVCHLAALNARVRRDPQDEDLVAALNQPGGHLGNGSGPLLAGAQGVRQSPPDRWLAVRKDRVLLAGLSSCLENPERLVYGEDFRVEDLLIVAKVEASACPAPAGLPIASALCPHRPTVEPRAVGPDGTPHSPALGRLQRKFIGV